MLIQADARHLPLVDACVDCVVTSPPYFGLRDYGTEGQIGIEIMPAAYIAAICTVFRELRRVLKSNGTVWLNLGDSYNSGTQFNHHSSALSSGARYSEGARGDWPGHRPKVTEMKTKDLMGIPWRVAFALQADGWYLRSDIIWHKPNPMPESVTDRPTKAHEYLFLLSKSEKYWYDASAIAEPCSDAMFAQVEQGYDGLGLKDYEGAGVQNPSSVKARIIAGKRSLTAFGSVIDDDAVVQRRRKGKPHERVRNVGGREDGYTIGRGGAGFALDSLTRNRRTVWTIPTMPYSGWQPNYEPADYVGPDGKPYRASADCLIHAPLAGRRSQQKAEGDEQLDREQLRSLDIDARHVARLIVAHAAIAWTNSEPSSGETARGQSPESTGDYKTPAVPIGGDGQDDGDESANRTSRTTNPAMLLADSQDWPDLDNRVPATSHSNGSRRTGLVPATTAACIVSAGRTDGTADTSALLGLVDSAGRNDGSKIAEGDRRGEPSARKAIRSVHTELPSCKCSTLGTDHFATMPEALVEPCILAGCKLGGLVLDPFSGSGTVLAVAERLGRRGVGVDLNPNYHQLAKKRTAQRGLRF